MVRLLKELALLERLESSVLISIRIDSKEVSTCSDFLFITFTFLIFNNVIDDDDSLLLATAEKFGITECVNPKDHDKPIQQVSSQNSLKRAF